MIYINLESPLILPVNYNHILQAVIYQGIGKASDFGNFMHEEGYYLGQRQYKMFQFSQLSGKYSIRIIKLFSEIRLLLKYEVWIRFFCVYWEKVSGDMELHLAVINMETYRWNCMIIRWRIMNF